MASPRVSIVVATWNRAALLKKTLECVEGQTFKDWELIVVNDHCTDNTNDIVREIQQKDARIVLIELPRHENIPATYNHGFAAARGEYIAIMDDDDPWCDEHKLEKQVAFLDAHTDHVACGSGMIVVDGNGDEKYRFLKPETDALIRRRMLFANPMANSTTLFRAAAGESVGWYNGNLAHASDWDFWLRLGKTGKLYNFKEYFSCYTMAGQNTSYLYARENLFGALRVVGKYKMDYPGYYRALCLHYAECVYAVLPLGIQRRMHEILRKLKQRVTE